MRNFCTLFFCLIASLSFSQSLPMTFDAPEDANWTGFNGTTTAVVEDPVNMGNQVLQMAGGTADFDGASISMDTYVDLSDDAANTITFRMYLPLDGSSSNEHLLKFEGGPSGATEQYFTTSGTGWQDVSVDFPADLGTQYPVMVIFTDAGVGNTATGTYYIDDIDGPLGDPVTVDQVPPGPAPDPDARDNEVLSIYSDRSFSNLWSFDYDFGSNGGEVNLADMGTNNALKIDLELAGYGQGTNEVTDISEYSSLRFDYWADSSSSELIFFLIDNNGMVVEYPYTIGSGMGADEAIVNEEWQTVEIPLSTFENMGFSTEHFFQWKIDASSNLVSKVIYLDNIYFYQSVGIDSTDASLLDLAIDGATIEGFDPSVLNYEVLLPASMMDAPEVTAMAADSNASVQIDQATSLPGQAVVNVTSADGSNSSIYTVSFLIDAPMMPAPNPTIAEANVISLYSDVYNNVTVDTWNTVWSNAMYEEVQIDGNATHRYSSLVFNGVETTQNPIDASEMDFMHLDVWTPNLDSIEVKLVDFLGDGFQGDNGDTESFVFVSLEKNEWNSIAIPLTDFDEAGLSARSDLNQYIFTAFPAGDGILFVDNVYFSRIETSSEEALNLELSPVFPNPASIGQYINLPENSRELKVFDATGKLVLETTSAAFSTQGLTSGTYLLRITDDKGQVGVQRLILH